MLLVYLVLFCAAVAVFVWYQTRRKYIQSVDEFPGPKKWFLIGNALDITSNPVVMWKWLRGYCKTYSTYRLWALNVASIHVVTPEDAEKILTSNTNISKAFVYNFMHPWFGTGLLTSTGLKWQKRRKMLTPAFHFSILQKFTEVIIENSQSLVRELQLECLQEKTNIVPLIQQSALNVICETAMGTKLDRKNKKHFDYIMAVNGMSKLISRRILSPWVYSNFLYFLTPDGWRQYSYLKTLKNFTNKVIHEREKDFLEKKILSVSNEAPSEDALLNKKKRLAMLDLLLKEKLEKDNVDNEGIREEVDTFMFEGHDTTAMALCYQFVLLANHPEIQEKIVEEISDVIGERDKNITFNDLNKLQYLEMVVKEGLRLYPSVGTIARNLTEDLQLTGGVAPAGSSVVVHFYDIHRDQRHFPDPERYDPERFLPENSKNRHAFAFVPFSAGPRNCIGQKFAMLEMKSIISHVLRNYILEPVHKPENLKLQFNMVIRNAGPVFVKFTKRQGD